MKYVLSVVAVLAIITAGGNVQAQQSKQEPVCRLKWKYPGQRDWAYGPYGPRSIILRQLRIRQEQNPETDTRMDCYMN
jgi:hypothetical protein